MVTTKRVKFSHKPFKATLAVAMVASLGRSLHKVQVEAGKKYSPGHLFSTILATASHSGMYCENVPESIACFNLISLQLSPAKSFLALESSAAAKLPLLAEIQTAPSSSPPFSEEQLPLMGQDVATDGGGGSRGCSVRLSLPFLLLRHFLLLLEGGTSLPAMRQVVQLWSKFCSCLATPQALTLTVSSTVTRTVGAGKSCKALQQICSLGL